MLICRRRRSKLIGKKTLTLPPAVRSGCEQPMMQAVRAHGIVDQAHLDALLRLGREQLQKLPAQFVGLKNEEQQVDMVLGILDRVDHGLERGLALEIKVHLVAFGDVIAPQPKRKPGQAVAGAFQMALVLFKRTR